MICALFFLNIISNIRLKNLGVLAFSIMQAKCSKYCKGEECSC